MGRILLALLLALPGPALADIAVTDDAGRQVELAAPAQRIVLTDGMGFLGLMPIDPDPVSWLHPVTLDVLGRELPGLSDVPDIGDPATGGSVEALIALAPDLVVLDPYYA